MTARRALVVGSGPGGSVAAMVLARASWDVTIFEKGANYFTDLSSDRPGTVFSNDELKRRRAFSQPDPSAEPRVFRASPQAQPVTGAVQSLPQTVGGGTVHWDAKTPRLWDIDFKKLSLLGPVPGADIADWPFDYAEISPYYEQIEELIGVAGDVHLFPKEPTLAHAPRTRPLPMPAGPPEYSSLLVSEGCSRVGLHPFLAPMAINSRPYQGRRGATTAGSAPVTGVRSSPAWVRSRPCARRCGPARSSVPARWSSRSRRTAARRPPLTGSTTRTSGTPSPATSSCSRPTPSRPPGWHCSPDSRPLRPGRPPGHVPLVLRRLGHLLVGTAAQLSRP